MVVVIYEGGRIPGAAEEGAAAGEMTGEGDQNRWWQYNAPMWHCTATVKKIKESTPTCLLSMVLPWHERRPRPSFYSVSSILRVLNNIVFNEINA